MKNRNLKIIFIILGLCCFFSFKILHKSEFAKISLAVEKKYNPLMKSKRISFHTIRMNVYKNRHPAFLVSNIDTLFLLEKFSIDDGAYLGKIWNQKDSITYKFSANNLDFGGKPFTKYMSLLVLNWDTAQIRIEEGKYSNMQPSYTIYATRVIKKNRQYKIDTISFKDFFNLKRDRYE